MKLTPIQRKGRVLVKARFGCLSNIHTLNVTRGCEFECVYCYARGYPGAPREEVYLYSNLPEKLAQELNNPRRRMPIRQVAFNTASDSFQRHPEILAVSYQAMTLLLERGIPISFLTKGWIPDRFIELFSTYPSLVRAGIGLVSISDKYQQVFEPGAATSWERLNNIERLEAAGVDVHVRIDPIVPFYTDSEEGIEALFLELAKRGVKRVILSYLHFRPAIIEQLRMELPDTTLKLLESCFETQPWRQVGTSTRSKLVPVFLRNKGYNRFGSIGERYGITCLVCACKNPDIPAQICTTGLPSFQETPKVAGQLSMFPC